ncbi:PREDICTED: perilipin-1-like, partial [Myotis brandtii]|uniref:perilipin-1-like n=1 Tax=Myotis brandtii TaxID=109478 RepID=UPI0007046770
LAAAAAAAREADHGDQTDSEGDEAKEKEKEDSDSETEEQLSEAADLAHPQGLLGSAVHTLQKAVQGTISAMLWAPTTVLGTAGRMLHLTSAPAATSTKSRAMSLSDALKGVTDNVVDTVVHYVPLPRLSLMEPESEFREIEELKPSKNLRARESVDFFKAAPGTGAPHPIF